MVTSEILQDRAEHYLKQLIADEANRKEKDFDTFAPFGELGIDSFYVLKIVKRLELDFGALPKTLLFENFNIHDLASYFIDKHPDVLRTKVGDTPLLSDANGVVQESIGQKQETQIARAVQLGNKGNSGNVSSAEKDVSMASQVTATAVDEKEGVVQILREVDAYSESGVAETLSEIYQQYKNDGSVSRGTRSIAPYVFLGSDKKGFFNIARCKSLLLAYAYTGPQEYFSKLLGELNAWCRTKNYQLSVFIDEPVNKIGDEHFSSTPFGVMQRVTQLQNFSLEGSKMRRLRYQVAKFEKSGLCRTLEYACGSDKNVDAEIAKLIDVWCRQKTMVNPLVHRLRDEIVEGQLAGEHRIFLTYLNDTLQNVILLSRMSDEINGYLMDLEFYPADMPLGGLEYAIVQIMSILAKEGDTVFSLGGTYGCRLEACDNSDAGVDKVLEDLHQQGIFNDEGNLQFKNKFRPENRTIYLCRPKSASDPDTILDLILMIADPDKMQSPIVPEAVNVRRQLTMVADSERPVRLPDVDSADAKMDVASAREVGRERLSDQHCDRSERAFLRRHSALAEAGYNPLNIPDAEVEFDFKTDSWSQLKTPEIQTILQAQSAAIQQAEPLNQLLKSLFPFAHFAVTSSGRNAERAFCAAFGKKGKVPQNLLFPTTIFHQIDNDFEPVEIPSSNVFLTHETLAFKGNIDLPRLQDLMATEADKVAYVCVELNNNAAGGQAVSVDQLQAIKQLLAPSATPLVLDATRAVENALILCAKDNPSIEDVLAKLREILLFGDIVLISLAKDFNGANAGLIAANDSVLMNRVNEVVERENLGLDVLRKKVLATALAEPRVIVRRVVKRVAMVRSLWQRLNSSGIPVVQPAGTHCILLDVKQLPAFMTLERPVDAFIAWLYLTTGIRAGAHSVGRQKGTTLNQLVRLAIPVGLVHSKLEEIVQRLITAFESLQNIPHLTALDPSRPAHDIRQQFRLVELINPTFSASLRGISSGDNPSVVEVAVPPSGRNLAEPDAPYIASGAQSPLAIIGMAGRYPNADNLNELWRNLAEGIDCIGDLPPERLQRRLQQGPASVYRGGFIDKIDKFDSLFFNISPREAEMMDPQERLFLEVAWEAIEDAGYYPEVLTKDGESRSIGVFVGAVWAMYQMLGVAEKIAGNTINPNSFLWSIANRVSYWMNLSGPSLTVDTACSSSLTALDLACKAIWKGDCHSALVGGVNLDVHPHKYDINAAGGALSADGVCRSFGKGANGYVAGEGIGALFIKPLAAALTDRDNILAVIRGIAVNHGGRTSGYTVPNPKAQAGLIKTAFQQAQIDPASVNYIEAHGTGTELGDPIEITGLSTVFENSGLPPKSCAVGSIKTNIGHLEAAAGVVSVCKVLLQMKHEKLAPSLHSRETNEHIAFDQTPFYVPQTLEPWSRVIYKGVEQPLRAGVSSFGAGGANAHVILEKYEALPVDETDTGPLIFPLSAHSEAQLLNTASRLHDHLLSQQATVQSPSATDIAFTLQLGRKCFGHRMAVVASSVNELIAVLSEFIAGKSHPQCFVGQPQNSDGITALLSRQEKVAFVEILARGRDLTKIARLWVDGVLSDWQGFERLVSGRRVSLPTYPFADRRHWAIEPGRKSAAPGRRTASLHPLIDCNESTFAQQRFRKSFTTGEFFIFDHLVSGIPTLPGVAYLELARKAGELAAGQKVQRIKNIIWASPLTVEEGVPTEAIIELKPAGNMIQFEVFSLLADGGKRLNSQGKIGYASNEELVAEDEYVDVENIRQRCAKAIDGVDAYPLFHKLGLGLGKSFQVLQEVYKNDTEVLGILELPPHLLTDFEQYILHPSLVDGSLQAGMGAQIGDKVGEMFVPYSIGEVEVRHPLTARCYSYVRDKNDQKAKVAKADVMILDENGRVLVKITDSIGIPLLDVHEKSASGQEVDPEFPRLYYTHCWLDTPLVPQSPVAAQVPLLVFTDNASLIAAMSAQASAPIIWVRAGERFEAQADNQFVIDPAEPGDFRALITALKTHYGQVDHCCFAWPLAVELQLPELSEVNAGKVLKHGIYALLNFVQLALEQNLSDNMTLLYAFTASVDVPQPYHEAVNGFAKTLQIEHPKFHCKTIEFIDADIDSAVIPEALVAEFFADSRQSIVRYRGPLRQQRSLAQQRFGEERLADCFPLRQQGVYLITGGLGGLGYIFAKFLAETCAARLVLSGRSALTDEHKQKIALLEDMGADVLYVSADIANQEAVSALVAQVTSKFHRIDGVLHSAGVLRDSYIKNKTLTEMQDVIAPKVYGTLALDHATRNESLDFFVTFSSLAAIGGNAGQADYCYANHFMDSFARYRNSQVNQQQRMGKTLSINWSLWADGGMGLDAQTEQFFKKNLGIKPLTTATGTDALIKGLSGDHDQLIVLEAVQEKIERAWGLTVESEPQPKAEVASKPAAAAGKSGKLELSVQQELSGIVVEFLKMDPEDVDIHKILLDLGFDSIGLTGYANAINDRYQLDVTPVLFFEYPSVKEIAHHIVSDYPEAAAAYHGVSSAKGKAVSDRSTNQGDGATGIIVNKGWTPPLTGKALDTSGHAFSSARRFIETPVAVVGISGVMPQSDNVDEFWQNLSLETNLITEIPEDRWDWRDFYGDPINEENKTNSKWGGFMREVDKFDPFFFGISPREAEMMDPQQRIFLQTVWHAIEDSGHKIADLAGTRTGLFVGVATNDYTDLMNTLNIGLDGYTASGNSHSVLVNRVSFLLNLRGPSAPLDTACSSSLIALHRAIESIHTGSSDMAIVGGVQVMLTPAAYVSFGMAGMLSDDGKCKTFDKRANGYVRGEGSGAIFLKTLEQAKADGNPIYAVVKSTAENHGGKVTALTAPNPAAQAELLIEAYQKAEIDPSTVGYIECHGTGTSLGDPIEIQALAKAFSELYKNNGLKPAPEPHCGLSSVKTNIGHLETAAGIAGLLKVLLSIKHRKIPATLHFEELNPYINLNGTPFYIVDKTVDWPAPTDAEGNTAPRRAGISSFGFGGANAHIVLEEYLLDGVVDSKEDRPVLIVLSAKSESSLREYAKTMQAVIDKQTLNLVDFGYTLQVGRDRMDFRLAFIANSMADVKAGFTGFLSGDKNAPVSWSSNRVTVAKANSYVTAMDEKYGDFSGKLHYWLEQKDLQSLAEAWLQGAEIDWTHLYHGHRQTRLSLPGYPFAKERYWFAVSGKKRVDSQSFGRIHPLVHQNISRLGMQCFTSRFTGKELFLAKSTVSGEQFLPGLLCLEMVRAAVAESLDFEPNDEQLIMDDIQWGEPLWLNPSTDVVVRILAASTGQLQFEITSVCDGQEQYVCSGIAEIIAQCEPQRLDLAQIKGQLQPNAGFLPAVAQAFESARIQFGDMTAAIDEAWTGGGQLLVKLDAARYTDEAAMILLPEWLVSGIAGFSILDVADEDGLLQPRSIGAVHLHSIERQPAYVWLRFSRANGVKAKQPLFDVDYLDEQGLPVVSIRSMLLTGCYATSMSDADRVDFEMLLDAINERHGGNFVAAYSGEDAKRIFADILDRIQ